jgi:phage internal scaffolding protein
MPEIYTRYDSPLFEGIEFTDPGYTQQQFKDDADINSIMERYQKTGLLTDPMNPGTRQPMFGDFEDMDFHEAQTFLANAFQDFEALPARIRDRFENDPGKLLDFLRDDNNRDEAIKLGLIEKLPAVEIPPKLPPKQEDPPVEESK